MDVETWQEKKLMNINDLIYQMGNSDDHDNYPPDVSISSFNGPYSGFHLKTRFWEQNDKNSNNFSVATDMTFVVGR